MTRIPNGYISIIRCGSEQSRVAINKFFNMLYETAPESLAKLCDKKNIDNLICGNSVLYLAKENTVPSRDKLLILKNMIQPERKAFKKIKDNSDNIARADYIKFIPALSKTDEFAKEVVFISNMHIVYVTQSDEDVKRLASMCKHKIIKIADISPNEIELDETSIHWFQTIFALYGLKLLATGKDNHPDKKPVPDYTKKSVKQFVKQFCRLSKTSETYMDEFYSTYTKYINASSGGIPIRRIVLKETVLDSYKRLKYKRVHHSDKNYKMVLLGIKLKNDLLEDAIGKLRKERDREEIIRAGNSFLDCLDSIGDSLCQ